MKKLLAILFALLGMGAAGCMPLMKANMAFYNGDYQAAIPTFRERLAQQPDDWTIRQRLGYALLKTGEPRSAAEEFKQAIAQAPTMVPLSYLYLGSAQLELGDPVAALASLRSFDDKKMTVVKEEVDRLITLIELEASRTLAKQALAQEAKLATAAVKADSYAVLNFGLPGPDENLRALQKALTAMTISDLAQVKTITVVERARLQALLDEMNLGQTGAVNAAGAPKVGRLLGADNLVVGNLLAPSGQLGVASSTASCTRGQVVGSFSASVSKDKFFELQKQVVAGILKVNNIKVEADTENALLRQYHTKSLQAATYYGQGLDAMDRGDWQVSKDFFVLAAKEDPNFGLAKTARDKSPAGLAKGFAGPFGSLAVATVEAAVDAQQSADGLTVGRSNTGGGGGGGG
ncbi:MAG: tetratricopeptide repeat protein [Humidesulfovibrio sp.]|uniref:tetratricopeptide repeat protein n=1 Tax=Humidesulfovibrio sp. TaxID=2910988 RepID=UPI0027EBB7A0|nr:tetratricopeptide repeat protein [Humidesulfovibrio sp.]MDQ7836165.1 tetratricopeptide repeat protein [Humidesulfovibrio sp.]